MYIIENEA